jgi:hypothetical protein
MTAYLNSVETASHVSQLPDLEKLSEELQWGSDKAHVVLDKDSFKSIMRIELRKSVLPAAANISLIDCHLQLHNNDIVTQNVGMAQLPSAQSVKIRGT